MKRSFRSAGTGVAMALVLGMFAVLTAGCGTIDADGFLGLEICDILNCDGLLFANLAEDHDDMDAMDDADAHDDEGDEHMDGVDEPGDDDHDGLMDGMDGHDDEDDAQMDAPDDMDGQGDDGVGVG